MVLIYCGGVWIYYSNHRNLERMESGRLTTEWADQAQAKSWKHDGLFYKELANRLQFFSHDPAVIPALYKRSLSKTPANCSSFYSYAQYASAISIRSRDVPFLWEETVRRCPMRPLMNRSAASFFLLTGQKEKGIAYLLRSLELDSDSAAHVYEWLNANSYGLQTMVEATPDSKEALFQLARYLRRKDGFEEEALRSTLQRLSRKNLEPAERILLVELAWRGDLLDLTEEQARIAASTQDFQGRAYEYLANVSWERRRLQDLEEYSILAQSGYLELSDRKSAARCAVQTVRRLARHEDKERTKVRLLKVTQEYPDYAPGFHELAGASRNESAELEIYYRKKAAELDPQNYLRHLAAAYLQHSRFHEAEGAYRRLLSVPIQQREVFLGLAKSLRALGKTGDAEAILMEGLSRLGNSEELLCELGSIYDAMGEYRKAASAYSECIAENPENVNAYNSAADAFMKIVQYTEARKFYEMALTRDPQNTHARKSLSRLEALHK